MRIIIELDDSHSRTVSKPTIQYTGSDGNTLPIPENYSSTAPSESIASETMDLVVDAGPAPDTSDEYDPHNAGDTDDDMERDVSIRISKGISAGKAPEIID